MTEKNSNNDAVKLFDRVIDGLALAGGIVLVLMVLLTVVDVILRKFFASPIFGAQNISEMALVLVVFLAMAHCGRTGGHVAVDLIETAPPRLLRVTDTLVNLIGGVMFAILGWRAALETADAFTAGRISNMLAIPHWPFYFVIALGALLYMIVLFMAAYQAITRRIH